MAEDTPETSSLLHVAIIMDGSGRWANLRGLPRTAGHREGARSVRAVVKGSAALGVQTLTLFAFSSDNWKRPEEEVRELMTLFERYLRDEKQACVRAGVRVNVIGRRDRLSPALREAIESIEDATAQGTALHLRIAVDYSSRDAIVRAAVRLKGIREQALEKFPRLLAEVDFCPPVPDVDLLIRTGGEQRLSDFMLWECAYAEMYFTTRLWPDFRASDLKIALEDFQGRERRFGGIPVSVG